MLKERGMDTTTTVEVRFTLNDYNYVVTATREEYIAVRSSVATRATDETKRRFLMALDAESEGRLVDAIDAAFEAVEPVSFVYAVAA